MPYLGALIVYRSAEAHHTTTVRRIVDDVEQEVFGSIHHPEQRDFAGLVTGVNDDGTCQLVIFPPNREARTVDRVAMGAGHGEFTFPSLDTMPEPVGTPPAPEPAPVPPAAA